MIGHEKIRQNIERHGLPAVSLFIGPRSVGKWTLARDLATTLADEVLDRMMSRNLTVPIAAFLDAFLHTAPYGSGKRVAVLYAEGASSEALSALLHTLEDVPTTAHVIIVRTTLPPPTILSRCFTFDFGKLHIPEVEKILLDRNFQPVNAARFAALSGGQVDMALRAHERSQSQKVEVLAVASAILNKDAKTLSSFAPRWSDEHTEVMARLAQEVATKRLGFFSEDEVAGIPDRIALKILKALGSADLRPRLVVNASLMSVLRGD